MIIVKNNDHHTKNAYPSLTAQKYKPAAEEIGKSALKSKYVHI